MSKIAHIKGDLFSAPPNTILVQACNTLGSWGAGITKAFKERYPSPTSVYTLLMYGLFLNTLGPFKVGHNAVIHNGVALRKVVPDAKQTQLGL
ncbi:hypothetical protein D9758_014801 [Tetrapyrgos nigripes]|uniref:Macro domain-containing protein n=1 Tax=Tetrapyrgos nigripes TaxID=182062 RepID=A0A8H5C6S2_9AGAR|nr:hypothetical protein D9758_014801 [Tetrapyrgos nigripes]